MPQYSGLAAVFWHGLGIIVGLWPLSCESNSFLVDHSAFAMARTQPWLLSYDGRDLIYLLLQPQLWEIQRCCVIMHWNSERCHFQWHCGVCHHVPECWQTAVCVIVEFVTVQLCVLPSAEPDNVIEVYYWRICFDFSAFSALTLLVGWQEGHLACKKT